MGKQQVVTQGFNPEDIDFYLYEQKLENEKKLDDNILELDREIQNLKKELFQTNNSRLQNEIIKDMQNCYDEMKNCFLELEGKQYIAFESKKKDRVIRAIKRKKPFKPTLALGGALLLLGSVGALEMDNIGFVQCGLQSILAFYLMWRSRR